MYRFHVFRLEVQAVRAGPDCIVEVGGQRLHLDAGKWAVLDHHGQMAVYEDTEFRKTFDPSDEDAAKYLLSTT